MRTIRVDRPKKKPLYFSGKKNFFRNYQSGQLEIVNELEDGTDEVKMVIAQGFWESVEISEEMKS